MERIRFTHVSKLFDLSPRRTLLRGHLRDLFRSTPREMFSALTDVSFTVHDGESLAVIGSNGAGKSTLLNLTTGLCHPDHGEVMLNGRMAALLELGSGFHQDLTGEENLRINASLLGLSRQATKALHNSIVDFSGLGQFIDKPLRIYSSGMVLRLAFSVAIHADPDILLIDEVLAVGDQGYQAKCFDRMAELRESGKTMVCVTHAPGLLRHMCDRALWLDHGRVMMQGELEDVLAAYEQSVAELEPVGSAI